MPSNNRRMIAVPEHVYNRLCRERERMRTARLRGQLKGVPQTGVYDDIPMWFVILRSLAEREDVRIRRRRAKRVARERRDELRRSLVRQSLQRIAQQPDQLALFDPSPSGGLPRGPGAGGVRSVHPPLPARRHAVSMGVMEAERERERGAA